MLLLHEFQLVLQLPANCPLTSLDFEDDIADALGKLSASRRDAARIALQRGHWRAALASIDLALADDPLDSPALHLDRARALCALHDIPQGVAELERLTRRTDLADLKGPVLLWNASLALNRSSADMKSALAMVRQALEHDLPPADSAYAHSLLAPSSPEALEHLRRAVQADPFHPQAQGRPHRTTVRLPGCITWCWRS